MASVKWRSRVVGALLGAGLALGPGWARSASAQQGPAASTAPNSVKALLEMGFASTPEGLEAAMASGAPQNVIAALKAASDLKSDAIKARALGLLRSKNFAVQLAAGKYLGSIGEPMGAQVVRNFGEAPREHVVEDHNLQLLVIDAAREVARHGHVDYAYQLPLLIERGDWTVKIFAAQALRDFRAPQDAVVESAWLHALAVYREAIVHADAEVRQSAVLFMRMLLESALTLDAVSDKVRDEFAKLAAEGPPAQVPEGASLDFAAVSAHLGKCAVRNPRDEAPKLDPDPRIVGQGAAEHLLMIIDKGPFDTLETDLDDRGQFEGLSKADWIAKVKREHIVPLDGVEKRILTRSIRTSQPSSYEVRVEIQGDQYDSNTGRWKPMVYRFTVTWWGYGWHFSAFERGAIVQSQPDIYDLPAPTLDEKHPEAQAVVSRLMKAMSDMDADAMATLLADDAQIRGGASSKAQFVDEMRGIFDQVRDQVIFKPVSYEFTPADDASRLTVKVEARSYNRIHNRTSEIRYSIELSERDGDWIVTRLDADSKKIEP